MCRLCNSEKESALHIFTKCPLTKALWFCCQLGIRLDDFNFNNITDFVKFLLNPPSDPYMGINGDDILQFGAIICDQVWKLRNGILFEGIELSHEDIRARLSRAFAGFKGVRTNTSTSSPPRTNAQWIVPCRGSLKDNVDAAVGKSRSIISAVARDCRGELVFACTKWTNTNLPLQAEVKALRWATFLSIQLPFESICIEGDSKVCIQAISNLNVNTPWRIQNIISEIIPLANHVNRPSFC